jgi:alkyl sulfatase BDS1-like metallo-beta-lactamase superfamily hydrolase
MQDFEDARRGLIASLPDGFVRGPNDRAAFSMKPFSFLADAAAPASVNPSLWRQARLNAIHGLFKVSERIYQVRGIDLANMTIIEGETGLVVVDALLTAETARAALDLYYANRPRKPVVALIYSHSHIDHFGGAGGIVSGEEIAAGRVKIYAPTGFMEHAVSENVLAGAAMGRRAQYMYGALLAPGAKGLVDAGLGKSLARGTPTLVPPTDLIDKSFDTRKIDGVEIVFQLTPGTEAPAEMNMYFPGERVLNLAENVSHTLHNLYTLRGAEIRDGGVWARYIDEALEKFGANANILIGQHHWPVFGQARLTDFVGKQRDLYKFINDQSLRLLNLGFKPDEIAERLKLPSALEKDFGLRGYYGTVKHNARAVYQKYLGWYDSNPAHLDPPVERERARKMVEYMGGADAVLTKARGDFDKGEYRWVADICSKLVFADPKNKPARELGAAALEQLGYQAESAPWRNEYLTGAKELREGSPTSASGPQLSADLLKGVSLDLFFDLLGARLNAEKADGKKLRINWTFSDLGKTYVVNLSNSALTHRVGAADPNADATITLTRPVLDQLTLKQIGVPMAVATGKISLGGNPLKLSELMSLFDEFPGAFPIIEP